MSNEPNKSGTKPAIQHSKSILDDRRIRLLLAIVGAIVAWMVVTIVVQPGTTKTIANVPVDFTYDSAAYTSRGLSIVSAPEKYVTLKVSVFFAQSSQIIYHLIGGFYQTFAFHLIFSIFIKFAGSNV